MKTLEKSKKKPSSENWKTIVFDKPLKVKKDKLYYVCPSGIAEADGRKNFEKLRGLRRG